MIIKELIALLEKLPPEWEFIFCFPDPDNLVYEYSFGHVDNANDFVYLPSEESEMMDAIVLDHLHLMVHKCVEIPDYLQEQEENGA